MQSVEFNYVPSSENLADILTKPLAKKAVVHCCVGIDIRGQYYRAYTEAGEVLKGLQVMLYHGAMSITAIFGNLYFYFSFSIFPLLLYSILQLIIFLCFHLDLTIQFYFFYYIVLMCHLCRELLSTITIIFTLVDNCNLVVTEFTFFRTQS